MAAMGAAFAMVMSTNLPATAIEATAATPTESVYAPGELTRELPAPAIDADETQSIQIASDAVMPAAAAEAYDVEEAPPPIQSNVANLGSVSLIESDAVVWPVQNPTKFSDGFGPRSAPCGGCSSFHDGVDFNPGYGTPVVALADGVVISATESAAGLGVNVEVEHNIDGVKVTSSYGHMQFGSIAVAIGQSVTAGQQVGLVGSTGQSTGPHMHLEMYGSDGVRFDGYAWLLTHAG